MGNLQTHLISKLHEIGSLEGELKTMRDNNGKVKMHNELGRVAEELKKRLDICGKQIKGLWKR